MLDLGRTLFATAERNPHAEALVHDDVRLDYAQLLDSALRLAAGLEQLGLARGDHLASVLQNRWEAALMHWACQVLGVIVTPLNWRLKPAELGYCLRDSEARAVVYEPETQDTVVEAVSDADLIRIAVAGASGGVDLQQLLDVRPLQDAPRATAEDISVMLYTSGTTGRPKGVPRRHRAERAAALAHVAQNSYERGERTLGVMPLYHTMGVRSLLAMALVDGCFVCQPRFDAGRALALIAEEGVTNLYLVPTLFHEVLSHAEFTPERIASAGKLGFAGAPMTDGLLRRVVAGFRPTRLVNHYGSSEVYTFTIEPDAPRKPGSAGKAGINQHIRVVPLGVRDPGARAAADEEGQIIADMASDEAFEGYWKRPDADEKAIVDGWYFTGDTGRLDADGDLFVTGRVDDMIVSGGENVSPVDVESVLSLHPAVADVAVVGLDDDRLGQQVAAFVERAGTVSEKDLDAHCRASELANFKRPRRYLFVRQIPKSPTGKILRRMLVAGDYDLEAEASTEDLVGGRA